MAKPLNIGVPIILYTWHLIVYNRIESYLFTFLRFIAQMISVNTVLSNRLGSIVKFKGQHDVVLIVYRYLTFHTIFNTVNYIAKNQIIRRCLRIRSKQNSFKKRHFYRTYKRTAYCMRCFHTPEFRTYVIYSHVRRILWI